MQSDTPVGAPVRQEFGIRLGAYLLDVVFVIVLALILSPLFGGLGAVAGGGLGSEYGAAGGEEYGAEAGAAVGGFFGAIIGIVVGVYVVTFLYMAVEILTGQTLGKMILKLKVGNQDGTEAPKSALAIRYALKVAPSLFAFLGLITLTGFLGTLGQILGLAFLVGCFFVLGEKRQAFHDLLSKTAVFKKAELLPAGSVAPSGNY